MSTTNFLLYPEGDLSFSQDGVTLTANTQYSYAGTMYEKGNLIYDYTDDPSATNNTNFTFSTELGKFAQIALIGVSEEKRSITASGWSMQGDTAIWTDIDGSYSVDFGTTAKDFSAIEFTISSHTIPDWLQPGDAWDEATKTLTINSNPVNHAYESRGRIQHVVVAANVTALGNDAFRLCSNIQTVTFENGSQLTDIGQRAFSHCSSLVQITIPAGVTVIQETAFGTCTGMQAVTFAPGSQLQAIKGSAFAKCENIKSVVLPQSMEDIGYNAFFSCSALDSVVIYAPSLTNYGASAFDGAHTNLRIYVPESSLATYKAGWAAYQERIFAIAPDPTPTDINDVVHRRSSKHKFIKDGELFIEGDGKTYNALGAEVK
jgi:hypothetical protein